MCTFYSKTQNRHPKQKSTAKPNIKKDVNKKTPTILPKGNAQGNTLLKTKPIFFSTSNAFKNYNKVKKEIIWFGKVFLEQKMLIPLLRKGISKLSVFFLIVNHCCPTSPVSFSSNDSVNWGWTLRFNIAFIGSLCFIWNLDTHMYL